MKTMFFSRLASVALLLALVSAAPISAAAKDKGLEVLISSDAIPSPEGFRPKPGKPIPYLLTMQKQTLGDAVAGVKLPDPPLVQSAVVAELEKQGFVRTGVGGAVPQVVIVATVGDANFAQPTISAFLNPLFEPDFEPYLRQVNVRQVLEANFLAMKAPTTLDELFSGDFPSGSPDINDARDLVLSQAVRIRGRTGALGADRPKLLALVGADKVERAVAERAMSGTAAERIVDATRDNLYYVTLTAFDAVKWREKQQVLLWRTTMLIDWRQDFSKSLAEMLAQAGPVFGTDVATPGFINTAQREGSVQIGPMQAVSDKESPASATPGAGAKK